jgi:hypothetical protein
VIVLGVVSSVWRTGREAWERTTQPLVYEESEEEVVVRGVGVMVCCVLVIRGTEDVACCGLVGLNEKLIAVGCGCDCGCVK